MAREFIQKSKRYAKEKNPKSINFAIELKSEKKLVGGIGLHKIDYIKKTVSIGSWLRENLWGRGIASEATKEIIDFVFYKLRFKKIELTCSEDNNASPAIAKKFGFKLKEIIKNGHASISTGKTTDKYCYELSKQNWIEWGKK
jgi:RimJ/RimL family protein N-acetyltransferase